MTVVDTRVKSGVLSLCGTDFSCQPTSVSINPSSSAAGAANELEVLCGDKVSDGGSAEDFTATLDITQIADFGNAAGLQAELWKNIGKECTFSWQPTGDAADTWTGKVKIVANQVGGTVGERLQPTVSLEITELTLPTKWGGTKVIPYTPPVVPITGVTAGIPGSFQPGTATLPKDLAELKGNSVVGDSGTAKPTGAWTTGQYVALGTGQANWSGTAWVAGAAA